MQQPSKGRIVIYSIPAHEVEFPAIITEVLGPKEQPTLSVNLTVFGMGGMPAQRALTVAHAGEVAGDALSTPRWDWPPRV